MAFYTRGISGYPGAVSNNIPRWLGSLSEHNAFLLPIMQSDVPWAPGIQRERTPCRQQNEDSEGLAEGRREAGKKGQGLQTFVLLKGSNIPEETVLTPGVWEKRNMTWLPLPKFVRQDRQWLRIDHSWHILLRLPFYGYSLRGYLHFSNARQALSHRAHIC